MWLTTQHRILFSVAPVIHAGFRDDDVYVCEMKYSTRSKAFKRIKQAHKLTAASSSVVLEQRAEELERVRVFSVFSDKQDGDSSVSSLPWRLFSWQRVTMNLIKLLRKYAVFKSFTKVKQTFCEITGWEQERRRQDESRFDVRSRS